LLIRVGAVKRMSKIKPIDRDVITIDRTEKKTESRMNADQRGLDTRQKPQQKDFHLRHPRESAASFYALADALFASASRNLPICAA